MLKSVKNATSEYNRHTAAINEFVYIMQYNLFNTVSVYIYENYELLIKIASENILSSKLSFPMSQTPQEEKSFTFRSVIHTLQVSLLPST